MESRQKEEYCRGGYNVWGHGSLAIIEIKNSSEGGAFLS